MPPRLPGIPAVPTGAGALSQLLQSMKQNIEQMNGTRGGKIAPLNSNATTDEIITKVNELIARLSV